MKRYDGLAWIVGPGNWLLTAITSLGTPSGAIVVFVITILYCQYSSVFGQVLAPEETDRDDPPGIRPLSIIIRINAEPASPASSSEWAIGAFSIRYLSRGGSCRRGCLAFGDRSIAEKRAYSASRGQSCYGKNESKELFDEHGPKHVKSKDAGHTACEGDRLQAVVGETKVEKQFIRRARDVLGCVLGTVRR
jgi:hypothetical protein